MKDPIRILYVDEHPLDCELVQNVLLNGAGNFQITIPGSRQEFEALLPIQTYDLVLADAGSFGFAGLQILTRIQEFAPNVSQIILTGTGTEDLAVQAIKQGADDYVVKTPRQIQHLPDIIKRALINRQHKQTQADKIRLWQKHAFRQAAVAELGQLALSAVDLQQLIDHTMALLCDILEMPYAKVMAFRPEQNDLVLRAGAGWPDEMIGITTVEAGIHSQAGYTLTISEPVVVSDFETETRFHAPPLLQKQGVVSGISVIIHGEKRPFGILSVHDTAPRQYNQEEVNFVQSIANILAQSIERHRLLDAERTQLRLSDTMRQVISALNTTLDQNQVLRIILDQLAYVIESDSASVMLLTDNKLTNVARRSIHASRKYRSTLEINKFEHIQETIETRSPIIITDTHTDPRWVQIRSTEYIRCWLGVPLIAQDNVIGLLNLSKSEPGFYTKQDAEIALTFAGQAAIAIQNARLFASTMRRARELDLLYRVNAIAATTQDQDRLLRVSCRELSRFFAVPRVWVALLEENGRSAAVAAEYNPSQQAPALPDAFLVLPDSTWQAVITKDKPLVYTEKDLAGERPSLPATAVTLLTPLSVRGQIVGFLRIDSPEPRTFSNGEIRLAQTVGGEVGRALETIRLYAQLRHYTTELEERVDARTQELKQANEKLKELDQLKTKFITDVSHELRTPVTSMSLYLSLIEHGKEDKRAQYMQVLKEETDRLRYLVEDILDLQRLTEEMETAAFGPVDANEIIAEVASVHRPLAREADLTLKVSAAAELPPVHGNHKQLVEALTKLVLNAIKYTPAGHVEIGAKAAPDKKQVCFWVQDTGIGVKAENVPHLFERFYRGTHSHQLQVPGTGLGLSVVKEIIDMHKGEVTVESEEGMGATFYIWLPQAIAEEENCV